MRPPRCLLGLALWISSAVCPAAVIQSGVAVTNSTVVDFDQFSQPGANAFTGTILLSPDVELSTTNTAGSFLGTGTYGLGDNGAWGDPRRFVGLDLDANLSDVGTLTFRFLQGPVQAAGLFINYFFDAQFPTSNVILEALAADGSVLESLNITLDAPISTPGGFNAGAFRGIARPTAEIAALTLSNGLVVADDLTYGDFSAIPEPSQFLPAAAGLLLLALRRCLQRR